MEEQFSKALEDVKYTNPNDAEKLELYGLFKQIYCGDNKTPKPWNWDLKAVYKWNAWEKNKGVARETVMKNYIDLVNKLKK